MTDDLQVKIGANIDDLKKGLANAKKGLKGFEGSMRTFSSNLKQTGQGLKSVGASLTTYVTLPLLAASAGIIKMATDFEESLNKVDVAFKNSSNEVRKFAKTTLSQFGIAEGSALDMAALFGDMATSMGLIPSEASKMSTSLVGLAGDLASFKNIGIKQATTALNGVFTGETESLKLLGIVMTETNLKQFAMEQGIQTNIKAMTQAEKVQLRYRYILDKTKNAQGDFARTQGGSANQMRIMQESVKELAVSFGQLVLPAFTKLVKFGNELINSFKALSSNTKAITLGIVGLGIALPTVITAIGGLITVLGAVLTPVGLVVAALAGLVYVVTNNWDVVNKALVETANYFIDLYNESLGFRIIVESIVAVFKNLYTESKKTLSALWDFIKDFGSNLISIFSGIKKVFASIWKLDLNLFKQGLKEVKDASLKNLEDLGDLFKDSGDGIGKTLAKSVKEGYDNAKKNKKIEFVTEKDINDSLSGVGSYISKKWSEIKNSIFSGGGGSTSGESSGLGSEGVDSHEGYMAKVFAGTQAYMDSMMKDSLTSLTEFDKAANEIITGSISNTFMSLGQYIGEAMANGGNVFEAIGRGIIASIGGFLSEMGGMLIKYGTLAVLKGKLDLAILAGGPVAIGAGIAAIGLGTVLVAAGAAIGAFANKGSSGSDSAYSGSSSGSSYGSSTSYSSSGSGGGTYVFEIQGTKLVGVLKNTLNRNKSLGGSLSLG